MQPGKTSGSPWDDTLGLLCICWTQVCNLCRLKLCERRLSPQNPKINTKNPGCSYQAHFYGKEVYKEDQLSNSTGGVGCVEFGKRFDILQGLVIHTIRQPSLMSQNQLDMNRYVKVTHAVSGASLSLFSSRYLTSEINRQPALLNSSMELVMCALQINM